MKRGLVRSAAFAFFLSAVGAGYAAAAAPPAKPAPARGPATRPAGKAAVAGKVAFSDYARSRAAAILDAAQSDGNLDVAAVALGELFDQVIAYAGDASPADFREPDFALRLVTQLKAVPAARRPGLLKYLRANDALAHELVFLVRPDKQKPADVYALLDKLREQRGDLPGKYASLAAAVCVVHCTTLERQVNENAVRSPDPLAVFDYYVRNEGWMFFGIRTVPAELLVWVVDTTADLDEMNWALSKYAGDKEVGRRFFDIRYDEEHFRRGKTKQLTEMGFNLPNILRYGGICADQAYFATAVGKAIGVPTAYTYGSSAEVAHAWVGFLQADKAGGWWNFDTGRYTAYRGVRGIVMDPQTREAVPDSQVSLLAELIGTKADDRYNAAALTDAAKRLAETPAGGKAFKPAPLPDSVSPASARPVPRKADTASALALVEMGLKQSAGYAPAWYVVRDLAKDGKLSLAEKKRWADVLQRLGGTKYADFTLAVLAPMIETVGDAREQNALWNAAFTMYQTRFDLAAAIRMAQGAAWEKQKNVQNAGTCYMDVIDRYANAGPFVITALAQAEKLLKTADRGDRVVALYEGAWAKIQKPQEMNAQATTQSNWYRVGNLYMEKLVEAGNMAKANGVRGQIEQAIGPTAADGSGKGGRRSR